MTHYIVTINGKRPDANQLATALFHVLDGQYVLTVHELSNVGNEPIESVEIRQK